MIKIEKDYAGWRVVIKADNNTILYRSRGFDDTNACLKHIRSIKKQLDKGVAIIEYENESIKDVEL